jgi:hypothetical protein
LKRRKDATSHIILDNLYLGEKEALQDINIEEYLKNPLTCDCSHSPFQYMSCILTRQLNFQNSDGEGIKKEITIFIGLHGPIVRIWSQKRKAIACDNCDKWFHQKCESLSNIHFSVLGKSSFSYFCSDCCLDINGNFVANNSRGCVKN